MELRPTKPKKNSKSLKNKSDWKMILKNFENIPKSKKRFYHRKNG